MKAVAVSLALGILLPSALQAKQLVDFCMMEVSHHKMMTSKDCCTPGQTGQEATKSNQFTCDNTQICACSVDTEQTENQFTVPTAKSSLVILSRFELNYTVSSPDEFMYKDLYAFAGQQSPPLYLFYNAFLN